jgi:hypothetical protein
MGGLPVTESWTASVPYPETADPPAAVRAPYPFELVAVPVLTRKGLELVAAWNRRAVTKP